MESLRKGYIPPESSPFDEEYLQGFGNTQESIAENPLMGTLDSIISRVKSCGLFPAIEWSLSYHSQDLANLLGEEDPAIAYSFLQIMKRTGLIRPQPLSPSRRYFTQDDFLGIGALYIVAKSEDILPKIIKEEDTGEIAVMAYALRESTIDHLNKLGEKPTALHLLHQQRLKNHFARRRLIPVPDMPVDPETQEVKIGFQTKKTKHYRSVHKKHI